MKKLTILASVIASLCLAFGFVTMPKAYAADGYSAKTYVPDATDFVNYWGGADNLSENDGGGVFTFAHASFTVPLEGRAIEMNTLFKMLSKKSVEEGGNGIDGWATYSFSATPGEERDNTFPYYGGAKDGYFLHITNYSGTTAPNCVEVQVVAMANGVTSSVTTFFLDNACNVPVVLSLKKAETTYTLTFTRISDGAVLKSVEGLALDESLFINEKGQTFFSTAIYEADGCYGNHWEHRGVAVFSAKVYTLGAEDAQITLEQTEYEYEEGKTYKPAVTVVIGDNTLVNNVDYYLEYADNKAVGTASVVVKYMGEYSGNADRIVEFEIKEYAPESNSEEPASSSETQSAASSGGCMGSVGGTAFLSLFALAGVFAAKKKRA